MQTAFKFYLGSGCRGNKLTKHCGSDDSGAHGSMIPLPAWLTFIPQTSIFKDSWVNSHFSRLERYPYRNGWKRVMVVGGRSKRRDLFIRITDFLHCTAEMSTTLQSKYGGGGGGLVSKSCLTLATPWTITYQAPLSMGFSRRELEWVVISFSRWNFLTQGWNPSLLHCRQILYQMTYQGNPKTTILSN